MKIYEVDTNVKFGFVYYVRTNSEKEAAEMAVNALTEYYNKGFGCEVEVLGVKENE